MRLPGVDFISSGYDAIKLVSNNKIDESKFRIFNLSQSGEDFTINNINYVVPYYC